MADVQSTQAYVIIEIKQRKITLSDIKNRMFYRFLSCSYNLFENNIQHMPGKTEEDQQNPDRQQITWPRSELGTSQIQFYTSLYGDTQYELTLIN